TEVARAQNLPRTRMSAQLTSRDAEHTARQDRSDRDDLAPGKQTLTAGLPVGGPSSGREPLQLEEVKGGKPGACDIPFPKTQYDGPNGSVCRRFEGVTTYRDMSEARLIAAGYKFWTSDGSFD